MDTPVGHVSPVDPGRAEGMEQLLIRQNATPTAGKAESPPPQQGPA